MESVFRGRDKELEILDQKYQKEGFVMSVIYGRRRIGKTRLINKFIKEHTCKCISFTAVERGETELLSMMSDSVLKALAPDMLGSISFDSFEKLFDYVGNCSANERIIFFIDEYPYLAKQCPYIQSVIQKEIDTNWNRGNLFFVICGSLVSFMKDDVLAASAPLHGRCDLEINLKPFNYIETSQFLEGYSNEDKAVVYGLTNGVAKYIEQFDINKSLETNIIEQFYSIGGYFSEEQVRTVVSGEGRSPAIYNSIVSAVATGHTKNSEIATFVGADDITYPLKVLVKADILEKRVSKKPYYVLNDSMLGFYFRYVSRATSLINANNGASYYFENVKENLHDYMGKVFEKIAKEYLLMNAGKNKIPIVTELSDYQNTVIDENKKKKQIEIDIIGRNGKNIVLACECKFRNEQFDKSEYEKLMDKIKYIPSNNLKVCIFSLGGFSDYVYDNATHCNLISLDEMYNF